MNVALIKSASELMKHIPAEVEVRRGRPPSDRRCDMPDCGRKHSGKGLCARHRAIKSVWGRPDHVWVRPPRDKAVRCGCPDHLGAPK